METHRLFREQTVAAPLQEVFGFFSQPENLADLTPDWLDFTILTPTPIEMKPGALIDYTISPFGIPMHWRTVISDYDPPHKFIDQQLKGPYAFWHHTHSFEKVKGGTKLSDEVLYRLPFGPLGELVHNLSVEKQLESIFNYRKHIIEERFGKR